MKRSEFLSYMTQNEAGNFITFGLLFLLWGGFVSFMKFGAEAKSVGESVMAWILWILFGLGSFIITCVMFKRAIEVMVNPRVSSIYKSLSMYGDPELIASDIDTDFASGTKCFRCYRLGNRWLCTTEFFRGDVYPTTAINNVDIKEQVRTVNYMTTSSFSVSVRINHPAGNTVYLNIPCRSFNEAADILAALKSTSGVA